MSGVNEYTVTSEIPGANEYRHLREISGLSPKSGVAAEAGLPNSLYAVCIRDGATLIGMGRVVGDGGLNFDVVDVAVHPEYQRQGLGTRIMQALMEFIDFDAYADQGLSHGGDDIYYPLYRQQFTLPAIVGQIITINQFHGDIGYVEILTHVIDCYDVRMGKRPRALCFSEKFLLQVFYFFWLEIFS